MMEGWIKVHRKLRDWQWYHASEMVHLFIHLLIEANREDRCWKGIEIKRGQLVTGREALSKQTGISERTIRTCLNRLKSTGEATIETTNRFSIITLCNYELYQVKKDDGGRHGDRTAAQQPPGNRPTTAHRPATNKNIKNIRIKENNKKGYEIDCDLCSEEFRPAVESWLEYKEAKGRPYKTQRSIELMYRDLLDISGNDPSKAKRIVEKSMSNNWDGLFPLQDKARYEASDRRTVAAVPGSAQGQSTL